MADNDAENAPAPTPTPVVPDDFLRRALRFIAIVCIAYACVSALSMFVQMLQYGAPRRVVFFGLGGVRVDRMLGATYFATLVLLLVGGILLLRRRPAGRTLLLIWAVSTVIFQFVSSANYLLFYFSQIRSMAAGPATAPKPISPPPVLMALSMLLHLIISAVFPAIVAWVLMQREVITLWARRGGGGFEVVPVASPRTDVGS